MLPVHWSRYTSRLTTSDTLLAHCLLSENSQETVLPMAKALLRNARQLKYFHQSHLRDMFYTTINILMRWRFQPDVKALSVQDSPGLSPRSNRWPSTMPGGSSCHLPRSRTVPHPQLAALRGRRTGREIRPGQIWGYGTERLARRAVDPAGRPTRSRGVQPALN
jgi:hypothetical protein